MNSSIKIKHLIIVIVVGVVGYFGYSKKDAISSFIKSLNRNDSEKIVDSALKYLNAKEGDGFQYFSSDFSYKLLAYRSFYKIEEWELKSLQESEKRYLVEVIGKSKNAFGMTLERNPIFVVEKDEDDWKITDSYGLFLIDGFEKTDNLRSDLEKDKLIKEVKDKCVIEDWSFRSSYDNSVKGKGTIFNGGQIPVEFLKIEITYSNKSGQVVNTDETYAVSDKLYPGLKRNFEWYTSNCYNCNRASIKLKFNDD